MYVFKYIHGQRVLQVTKDNVGRGSHREILTTSMLIDLAEGRKERSTVWPCCTEQAQTRAMAEISNCVCNYPRNFAETVGVAGLISPHLVFIHKDMLKQWMSTFTIPSS